MGNVVTDFHSKYSNRDNNQAVEPLRKRVGIFLGLSQHALFPSCLCYSTVGVIEACP